MMLKANDKLILTTSLFPPQFSFDGDPKYNEETHLYEYKLRFDLMDERDNSRIEYKINNGSPIEVLPFRNINFNLPLIDTIYTLTFNMYPRDSKYKGYQSNGISIWKNDVRCSDFQYEEKYSPNIIGYIGTSNTVWIPEQHNFKNVSSNPNVPDWRPNYTTYAELTEYPYVINTNYLHIRTPSHMNSFWIKGDMIETFDIDCPSFLPIAGQFKDLGNLKSIDKLDTNIWQTIPEECFMNCVNFEEDDDLFKNTTLMGHNALYNTPKYKTLYFAGTATENYSQAKTVFTKASTIDGLTEDDLFNTPTSHGNTVFVNCPEGSWERLPADRNATIRPLGINNAPAAQYPRQLDENELLKNTPELQNTKIDGMSYVFESSDPNVIGFRLSRKSSGYTTAEMVHIPQQLENEPGNNNNTIYQADHTLKLGGKKYFIIYSKNLENKKNGHLLGEEDVITLQAIDRTGYLPNIINKRLDGKMFPTFKHQVAFFTQSDGSTLTLNGSIFATNVPKHRLYIYFDAPNTEHIEIRIYDKSGNYKQIYNDDYNKLGETSNPFIWYVDLDEWYDVDKIQALGGFSWVMDEIDDFYFTITYFTHDGSEAIPIHGQSYGQIQLPQGYGNKLSTYQKLSFTY